MEGYNMKKTAALILAILMVIPLAVSCTEPGKTATATSTVTKDPDKTSSTVTSDTAVTIYVSASGDDTADGTKEKPFATVQAAIDHASAIKDKDVVISVGDGVYTVSQSVAIPGERPKSLTIIGSEKSVISGGIMISGSDFEKPDDEISARLQESVKDNIVSVDLKKYGYDAEKFARLAPDMKVVYLNGEYQTLSRFPNSGMLKTKDATLIDDESGDYTVKLIGSAIKRMASWKNLDDVYMFGYLKYTWASAYETVSDIDTENKTVRVTNSYGHGIVPETPYCIFNAPEELDMQGEYYISPEGVLYMYPNPDIDFANATIEIPNTDVTLFNIAAGNPVVIKDLTISNSYGAAVSGSNNVTLDGCNIAQTKTGVWLGGNCTINNCDIYNLTHRAVSLDGGDRITLTPSGTSITNSHIHKWALSNLCFETGITLSGVGILVAHNEIDSASYIGLWYTGNNHIVEYNEIYNVALDVSDSGAIYCGRSNLYGGVITRYNYIHDTGVGTNSVNGIYWDDCASGQTAYGNVVVNAHGVGILIGGGRAQNVTGNVFVGCGRGPIEYDARGWRGIFGDGTWKSIVDFSYEAFEDERFINDTWKAAFPWLFEATLTRDPDPDDGNWLCAPGGSTVKDNVYLITSLWDDAKDYAALTDEEKALYKDRIDEVVRRFSDYENPVMIEVDMDGFTLEDIAKLDLPDFIDIPSEKIGRNK